MNIDIVILTKQRTLLLDKCLRSLEAAKIDEINIQVLVVMNGEDEETEKHLKEKHYDNLNVRYKTISETSNGAARNSARDKFNSEWVFFIDDDAWVLPNYFQVFYKIINENPSIDILGGSDCAKTSGDYYQRLINALLNSPIAMGPTSKRHDVVYKNKIILGSEQNLILCNLWIRTSFFKDKKLSFPETLIRNEENHLLNEARTLNANIYYSHSLKVLHLRRDKIYKILLSTYYSGQSRAKMTVEQSFSNNSLYFVPLLCLIIFIILPFEIYIKNLLIIYLLLVIFASIKNAWLFKIQKSLLTLIILHPAIHISYSIGMLSYPVTHFIKILKNK